MAAWPPNSPDVGVADVEHHADPRRRDRRTGTRCGRCPGRPSRRPGTGSARSIRLTVSGTPSSLFRLPTGATVGPAGSSTWASRSLVEVLPCEPVIADDPQPGAPPGRPGPGPAGPARPAGRPPPAQSASVDRARRQRSRRAGGDRAGDVVMPVDALAGQRHEQRARADRSGSRRSPSRSRPPASPAPDRARRRARAASSATVSGIIDATRACRPTRSADDLGVAEREHLAGRPPGPSRAPCPGRRRRHPAARRSRAVPDGRAPVAAVDHLDVGALAGRRRRGRRPAPAARIAAGVLAARVVVGDDHHVGAAARPRRPSARASRGRGRRRSRAPRSAGGRRDPTAASAAVTACGVWAKST